MQSSKAQEEERRQGADLTGVTARECSSQRFLGAWASWGGRLSSIIPLEEPLGVRTAAWGALSHIIARCSDTQQARKHTENA